MLTVLLVVTGISGIVQKLNVFVSMVNFQGKINTEALQIENKYRHSVCFFQACMDGYTGRNCSSRCPDSLVRVAF